MLNGSSSTSATSDTLAFQPAWCSPLLDSLFKIQVHFLPGVIVHKLETGQTELTGAAVPGCSAVCAPGLCLYMDVYICAALGLFLNLVGVGWDKRGRITTHVFLIWKHIFQLFFFSKITFFPLFPSWIFLSNVWWREERLKQYFKFLDFSLLWVKYEWLEFRAFFLQKWLTSEKRGRLTLSFDF